MSKKSIVDREALRKRVREIRGDRTLSEFAELVGVSIPSVKRYEDGALPDVDVLLRIAKLGKIDLGRLLTGNPLPADVRDSQPLNFEINQARSYSANLDNGDKALFADGSQYISVPLIKGGIAAGEPIILEENVIDHILLHRRVLSKTGASRNLVACRVDGESMTPHLNSGDIVVIDREVSADRVAEKKIYAVFNDGGVTAKMLQKEGYHLYLVPLNHAYRVQHIDLRENKSPIVGLVIGAWRNFEGEII